MLRFYSFRGVAVCRNTEYLGSTLDDSLSILPEHK